MGLKWKGVIKILFW